MSTQSVFVSIKPLSKLPTALPYSLHLFQRPMLTGKVYHMWRFI